MRRILTIIALLALFPVFALAGKYYNGSSWVDTTRKYYNGSSWVDTVTKRWDGSQWVTISGGGGTPTITASNTSPDGTYGQVKISSFTMGQSIVATGGPFYSLTITIQSTYNAIPSGTINCRIDDDQDMSSEYLEQVSYSYGGYGGGGPYSEQIELISSTNPTTPNGTLYFSCQSSSAITVQRYDITTTYSDGQYYYASYPSWNITSTLADRDMTFVFKELK